MRLRRSISLALAALLALFALTGCQGGTEPGISHIDWENQDERAPQFVTALVDGDYTVAAEGFDAEMQRALSVGALRRSWEGMCRQAGAFVAIEETQPVPNDEYDIYNVITRHEKSGVNTRVVFSHDGLVAGLFFTFTENPA